MSNVIKFTGVTKLDLAPDDVLEQAKGKLQEVVIVGLTTDGVEYFASSKSDASMPIFHFERAKYKLMKMIDKLTGDDE